MLQSARRGARHRSLALTVAVAAICGLTAQGVEAKPVPKDRIIQPGAAVCLVGGPLGDRSCSEWGTLNFVFRGRGGTLYIGAPAHNFSAVGNRAWVRGDSRPFGRVVFDDDSVDFLHPGDPLEPGGTDFALIKIDRKRRHDVQPAVRHFGGPTGIFDPARAAPGADVDAFGQGRGDLRNPTGPRSGKLIGASERVFSSTVREAGGDSGMPYLLSTGEALGVNATCPCGGGPGAYPTIQSILERLRAAGFDVSLVTAPERR